MALPRVRAFISSIRLPLNRTKNAVLQPDSFPNGISCNIFTIQYIFHKIKLLHILIPNYILKPSNPPLSQLCCNSMYSISCHDRVFHFSFIYHKPTFSASHPRLSRSSSYMAYLYVAPRYHQNMNTPVRIAIFYQ